MDFITICSATQLSSQFLILPHNESPLMNGVILMWGKIVYDNVETNYSISDKGGSKK